MMEDRRTGFLDRVLASWDLGEAPSLSIDFLDRLQEAYLEHTPFENVTKLIKAGRATGRESAVRGPVEFWKDHLRWKSGGTCFAATAAYRFLLRYLGFSSKLLFCRLPAENPQAHTALWVTIGGRDLLVDVGYALPLPVALSRNSSVRRRTSYYDMEVRPGPQNEFLVFTEDDRGVRFRYRFQLEAVSEERYDAAWQETFRPDAPYMRRLALGRFEKGTRYLYKDPSVIYAITRQGESEIPLGPEPEKELSRRFGIPQTLIHAAARSLGRKPNAPSRHG